LRQRAYLDEPLPAPCPWIVRHVSGSRPGGDAQHGATFGISCPGCNYNYVHLGDVETIPNPRGLHCYCEGGHSSEIIFQFHKGETSMFVQNVENDPGPDLERLTGEALGQ